MKERLSIKDIIFFAVIILMAIGCLAGKMVIDRETESSETADMKVGFHIKGEVNKSGYYELEFGSRIKDAIEKAGGATQNADIDKVNLAERIIDGQEIYIPAISKNAADTEKAKININTADIYTLCSLKGIGEAIAGEIIEYRDKKGGFKSTSELKKISGIGSEKYEEIKNFVTVK
ncbi:MAG: ComEA family DNA-binding protein [Clostridia bacterium]|nr:ComEA family DNA-binding protein [Clostridia bacterium]